MQPIEEFPVLEFIPGHILPRPPGAIEFRIVNLDEWEFDFSFEGEQRSPRSHQYDGNAWIDLTEP